MATYLDDLAVGQKVGFGSYEVKRDEVISFARAYDPQDFHLDDEAAAANPIFGRLSASGWHTAAMTMRMMADHAKATARVSLGSPGIDELRWLRPVYPGDTLRAEIEVLEVRPSRSRPEMGVFRSAVSVFNQDDVKVLSMIGTEFVRTRPQQG